MTTVQVPYEQAVYGSFPFWDRGYAVLAQSPGCRPEWLAGLRLACQRFGERPAGAGEARSLFALPIDGGRWAIVGVGPQGLDDRGRPGALAFHAIFVEPRDYRSSGGDPFAFAGLLRNDWSPTTALDSGTWTVVARPIATRPADARATRIASALARGRRVALEAPGPIDALAREVWWATPPSIRGRATLATWAFGNENRFDLVAVPKLSGVALDPSYLDPDAVDAEDGHAGLAAGVPPPGSRRGRGLFVIGVAVVLAGVGLGSMLKRGVGEAGPSSPTAGALAEPENAPGPRPPERSAYPVADDPDERRAVTEGLVDLAERFGVLDAGSSSLVEDPSALMTRLSARLRYRGPFLSRGERSALNDARGTGREPALALRWDALVRRFADDRHLPRRFTEGPLRWQLDTLAWSFHLDDGPGARLRSPAEVLHALAEALAVDVPLPPSPLAARFPALSAYRSFLGKLPRR